MGTSIDAMIADVVVQWIQGHVAQDCPPRLNMRFLLSDKGLARAVRETLERGDGRGRVHFVVRCSSDEDAVKMRHGVPPETPQGASVVYALFWCPGSAAHERNAYSLMDLRAVHAREILGRSREFILAGEQAIYVQCDEAAQGWGEQHEARAREHLRAAWDAVRICLRERQGGRQRSIPLVDGLPPYCRFLESALVPAEEWADLTPARRAGVMVRRWGTELATLRLFSLPALASVLGVKTDGETIESAKRTREASWADALADLLADNKEYAVDSSSLADAIAGKKTVAEQLSAWAKRVPLARDLDRREAATAALERFCHAGDETELRQVEWMFLQDPTSRRSASLGLKGLLLARGQRAPRQDPLERLTQDTQAALEAAVGEQAAHVEVLRSYVSQQRSLVAAERAHGDAVAEALQSLAVGTVPAAPQETAAVLLAVASSEQRKPDNLQHLASRWRGLVEREDEGAVQGTSVLLGLARLLARRAFEQQASEGRHRIEGLQETDTIVIAATVGHTECRLELRVDDWSSETLDRLSTWIRSDLREAVLVAGEEDDDAEDESEEEQDEIALEVRRKSGGKALGALAISWSRRGRRIWRSFLKDTATSWTLDVAEGERALSGPALERALASVEALHAHGEAPQDERIGTAWERYAKCAGTDLGSDVAAMVAPVDAAARAWVDTWASAVTTAVDAAGSAGVAQRRDALQRQMSAAVEDGRFEDAQSIQKQIRELPATPALAGGGDMVDEARRLLRIGTVLAKDPTKSAVALMLMPHHPLVVRLRALADRMLGDILCTLCTVGWPELGREDLEEALSAWGQPEPMHAYGYQEGDPLAFDGWLDGVVAVFSPLRSGHGIDAASLGVREVGSVLSRYAALFPAAADRLRLQIRGDAEGRWGWQILRDRLRAATALQARGRFPNVDGHFTADVDLVTSLDARQTTYVEQEVYSGREDTAPFELGPEGAAPRVRVRRRLDGDAVHDPVHLALVVGEQIPEFRPVWSLEEANVAPRVSMWDPSVLFAEPAPTLSGYAFSVADPDDVLCSSVARLVSIASGKSVGVFRERYSFDPTRCEEPLRRHQGRAHWLVLASRQPLYRAVQQAGRSVATLVDFYTLVEGGRPLHICVSLNAARADADLKRLDAALADLLGEPASPVCGKALVAAALRLAPGLAMQCVGASGAAHLGGLVGLLLTSAALAVKSPGAIVLSLDEHHGLLGGRGQLGDLLVVSHDESKVCLSVGESKFTTASVDAASRCIQEAQLQIKSSVERLQHLAVPHPVALRTRNRLVRALVRQIHMAPVDGQRLASAEKLISLARDPSIPIVIAQPIASTIHVWSVAGETQAQQWPDAVAARVHVADREETLATLRRLESSPLA